MKSLVEKMKPNIDIFKTDHGAIMREIIRKAIEIKSVPCVDGPMVVSNPTELAKLYTELSKISEPPLVLRFSDEIIIVWKSWVFTHILEKDYLPQK